MRLRLFAIVAGIWGIASCFLLMGLVLPWQPAMGINLVLIAIGLVIVWCARKVGLLLRKVSAR